MLVSPTSCRNTTHADIIWSELLRRRLMSTVRFRLEEELEGPVLESFRSRCIDIRFCCIRHYNPCVRLEVSTALLSGLNRQPQHSNCRAAAFPGHSFAELPMALDRGGGIFRGRGIPLVAEWVADGGPAGEKVPQSLRG